jgi:very-short-patch-repair endonuclease
MIVSTIPKQSLPSPLSKGEEAFALHCRVEGLEPQREYTFHPKRKWRFDFAFPEPMIAIEIEGGVNGRHQRIGGFVGDCHKYNSAALLGWRVLRYTTDMVMQGTAINDVLEMLK